MKNLFLKLKASITTLWITLISFNMGRAESWYWVPYDDDKLIAGLPTESSSPLLINLAQRIAIIITFIIWIVSLIMILKAKDKDQKKRRIKWSIIIIVMLVTILITSIFLLKRYIMW